MADKTMKNKHMDLKLRISIQLGIRENRLLKDIGKEPTTLLKKYRSINTAK